MNKKIEKFEDLKVWKESMPLATKVYERNSSREFIQFSHIAKASCGELTTRFYLAKQTKTIDKDTRDELPELSKKLSAMLFKFIKPGKEKFN